MNIFKGSSDIEIEIDEYPNGNYVMIFAHGAGAPMHHKFMVDLSTKMTELNGIVIRFNFPYVSEGRKSPGSPKPNIAAIGELVAFSEKQFPELPLFLSGKSYGGRMSSHWLAENPKNTVRGMLYFGFPLHAPGKDSSDRAKHLYELNTPQLFIQGTRDLLANYDLIKEVVKNCKSASLYTIESADHSFKVPKKITGKTYDDVITEIALKADEWIISQLSDAKTNL